MSPRAQPNERFDTPHLGTQIMSDKSAGSRQHQHEAAGRLTRCCRTTRQASVSAEAAARFASRIDANCAFLIVLAGHARASLLPLLNLRKCRAPITRIGGGSPRVVIDRTLAARRCVPDVGQGGRVCLVTEHLEGESAGA
jgi:hypothetical protein